MRLLDRYLLREFLVPLGYCLGGFFVFWISFQLISELDEFQRARLSILEIAEYFWITSPEILSRVVPIGLLLAMLYALNNHSRYNELTAMRVAGISLWRLSAPYFLVSVTAGLLLFCLNEYWMPDSADRAERLMKRHLEGGKADLSIVRNLTFKNERLNRAWIIGEYNIRTHEMARPHVEWRGTNDTIFWIDAARATRSNEQWVFQDVQILMYATNQPIPARGETNRLVVPEFHESPELIRSEIKYSSMTVLKQARGVQLSLREIQEYQKWHPERRADPKLNTKFHARLAAPWTCPIIVLIALPFGAAHGRRNVFVGVASSIFLGFTFFVLQRFGEAAGMGGHLPAWLAGWLPNLLFGILGVWLTRRVK